MTLICRPLGVDREHRVAKKKKISATLKLSPLTWGVGFSTKPELVPLVVGGQQRPGSPAHMVGAALSAKGSSLNKWLLSLTTPNLRVGKSSLR